MTDDVVELIRAEHGRLSALFAGLAPAAADSPLDIWAQAAALLLAHLAAAEEISYPPALGRGAGVAERRAALVADHADIRDAVDAARFHEAGSRGWWLAVDAARAGAARHIDLAEATLLGPLGDQLAPQDRALLSRQWRAFTRSHALDAGRLHG